MQTDVDVFFCALTILKEMRKGEKQKNNCTQ